MVSAAVMQVTRLIPVVLQRPHSLSQLILARLRPVCRALLLLLSSTWVLIAPRQFLTFPWSLSYRQRVLSPSQLTLRELSRLLQAALLPQPLPPEQLRAR